MPNLYSKPILQSQSNCPVKLAATQSDFDENGQLKLTEKQRAVKVRPQILT